MEYSLEILAQESGISLGMVKCGLLIFEELGLLRMTMVPLKYQMLPSGKVSLENSKIRERLLALSDENNRKEVRV